MKLVHKEGTAEYQGVRYKYTHWNYLCEDSGELFTTTELDELNTRQVYDPYRAERGIPFPDEIIALRRRYGVSAPLMSKILGFGINQYHLYEIGNVPSLSNARLIAAVRDKGVFAQQVRMAWPSLSGKERKIAEDGLAEAADEWGPGPERSALTGYVPFLKEKAGAAIRLLLELCGPVFVTKMNKLLFYCDFLSYKRTARGITGLKYTALQYGPVPERWMALYSQAAGVGIEERASGPDCIGSLLKLTGEPRGADALSESEQEAVREVAGRFKAFSSAAISEFSHREDAWKGNERERCAIDYRAAFSLSIG